MLVLGYARVMRRLIHERVTRSVIESFFEVCNGLGFGFLEHVYRSALCYELRGKRHNVARELGTSVMCKGLEISRQRLDLKGSHRDEIGLRAPPGRAAAAVQLPAGNEPRGGTAAAFWSSTVLRACDFDESRVRQNPKRRSWTAFKGFRTATRVISLQPEPNRLPTPTTTTRLIPQRTGKEGASGYDALGMPYCRRHSPRRRTINPPHPRNPSHESSPSDIVTRI